MDPFTYFMKMANFSINNLELQNLKIVKIKVSSYYTPHLFPAKALLIFLCSWTMSITFCDFSDKINKVIQEAHVSPITTISFDSFRNKFSLITGANDSSIICWDLSNKTPYPSCSISAHTARVIATAISTVCDLVVSVDANGNLAYSTYSTGSFIRIVNIKQIPDTILLSQHGFVVVICNSTLDDYSKTTLILYDFGGRHLTQSNFDGHTISSCLVEFPCTLR